MEANKQLELMKARSFQRPKQVDEPVRVKDALLAIDHVPSVVVDQYYMYVYIYNIYSLLII